MPASAAGPWLLVGATGDLGGRIASRLAARGLPWRALVRPGRDGAGLRSLGATVVEGDLRDLASLRRAAAGCAGVISTATAMGRALGGERISVEEVDGRGTQSLITAAEEAGADRFVYVSAAGIDGPTAAKCPLGAAKLHAEGRLRASRLREVVVRPDIFMEVWLSPLTGFDWRAGRVTVYGRGDAPAAFVSSEDVAELTVRLAVAPDPPRQVEFGGPELATCNALVAMFERATGRRFRVRRVPRLALRLGAAALRRARPHLASVMALSLAADLETTPRTAAALRDAGIAPLAVGAYVGRLTAGR